MTAKKTVVGTVVHPTLKMKADVFLNGTQFRAKFHDQLVDGVTYDDVHRQLLARMEAMSGVGWVPIIELQLMHEGILHQSCGNDPLAGGASLAMKRYWFAIAGRPADGRKDDHRGSWSGKLMAPWECTTNAQRLKKATNCYVYSFVNSRESLGFPRNKDGTLALPVQVSGAGGIGNGAYLLLHTDALWTTLGAIVARLHDTRAQLRAMVATPESVALLEGLGQRLMDAGSLLALPAGKKR